MKLYNSLTRQVEELILIEDNKVRFYSCGQTVYEDVHIGNARTYSYWDVLVRYLRWRDYKVFWVQNFTDVGHLTDDADAGEDKIIKTAIAKEIQPMVLVETQIRKFYKDLDALNIMRADINPRATGEIPEMIEFVKDLQEKGFAYEVNGSLYFDVTKLSNYGELSPSSYSEETAGARIAVNPEKKNPRDFALWIRAPPEHLMKWPSPWGIGYPGWHLECSVMSQKYLGDTVDIHAGGIEHRYLHHPNEIAQSEARTGKKFVNYWIHAAHLTINGGKMGKSLGNFILVQDLLKEFDPMLIRLFLINSHYRKGVDYNQEVLSQTQILLDRIRTTIATIDQTKGGDSTSLRDDLRKVEEEFISAMEDDLNTVGALQAVLKFIKTVNSNLENEKVLLDEAKEKIILLMGILGINLETDSQQGKTSLSELIDLVVNLRTDLRKVKQFELADQLRTKLGDLGIQLEDKPEGTIWKMKS
ncbi:MAG: cysteine--tRNA ligase [Candidatus Hodarchaeales archaeon]